MFLELIATVFAGIAMAGLVMLLNRTTGGRLPKWAMPVGAGLAMIAATISNEYSWHGRNVESLPEGMQVIQTVEKRAFYQPWTYVAPYVHRFIALDTANLQSNANLPDQYLADLYLYGRWMAVEKLSVLIDCEQRRRAPLMDDVQFGADGRVENAEWFAAPEDDPIVNAVCEVS